MKLRGKPDQDGKTDWMCMTSQKLDEGKYSVQITVSKAAREAGNMPEVNCDPTPASNKVVVIRSSVMGEGIRSLEKC